MADEKKDERIELKEGRGEPGPVRSTGTRSLILVYLGVFLVATAGFAWMEGLFSPAPKPPLAHLPDSRQDSTVMLQASPAQEAPEQVATGSAQPSRETDEWLTHEKAELARTQSELDVKSRELEQLKSEIEQLLARVKETKSERLVMMAKLYDSMEPEAVARQISSMDDRTIMLLLPQMNSRTAAKVMAAIDPKRAAQITTKMLALEL